MAIKKIVRYPDSFLRSPTTKVAQVNAGILKLIEDMIETMYACNGAGIAAIQVGAKERIFIIDSVSAGLQKKEDPLIFINPTIEYYSEETDKKEEGCLSFPGIFVPIRRSLFVRLKAMDVHGRMFVKEAEGFLARALQHEQDHLDNRLLIDYVALLKKKSIEKKMSEMTDEEAQELLFLHGE